MLATTHLLAGAALGGALKRPTAAAAAGMLSHLLLDVVPHWGESGPGGSPQRWLQVAYRDAAGLVATSAAIAAACPPALRAPVAAGAFGGLALDLHQPSMHLLGRSPWPKRVSGFHARIQQGRDAPHRLRAEALIAVAGTVAVVGGLLAARRAARRAAQDPFPHPAPTVAPAPSSMPRVLP